MTFHVRTPLRLATEHAVRIGVRFTTAEVAAHAAATELATSRYLQRLVADGVLDRAGDGFTAGARAPEWLKQEPKTRPGGDAKDYRRRQGVLDAWRKRDWDGKRAGGGVLMRQPTLTDTMQHQEAPTDTMTQLLSLKDAAEAFGVHKNTVARWVSTGVIRAVKIGAQTVRVPETEIKRVTELK